MRRTTLKKPGKLKKDTRSTARSSKYDSEPIALKGQCAGDALLSKENGSK